MMSVNKENKAYIEMAVDRGGGTIDVEYVCTPGDLCVMVSRLLADYTYRRHGVGGDVAMKSELLRQLLDDVNALSKGTLRELIEKGGINNENV